MKFNYLIGHRGQVNCVTYWNTVAASCSDDNTVIFWDLRTMLKANQVIGLFDLGISSICHNPVQERQLFVATGNAVVELDTRNLESYVSVYPSESDDPSTRINRICVEPEGFMLSSCNNKGEIDIFNVFAHERRRIVNMDTPINNVVFYRQGRDVSLFASGYNEVLYHYTLGGRMIQQSTLPVIAGDENGSIIPPIINHLHIDYMEDLIYAGCMDGSIRAICPDMEDDQVDTWNICKPHSSAVNEVCTGRNIEGMHLLVSVGCDYKLSVCSKTGNDCRYDQQLHVKLRNKPKSLCFVDTVPSNSVLCCSDSDYLIFMTDIA